MSSPKNEHSEYFNLCICVFFLYKCKNKIVSCTLFSSLPLPPKNCILDMIPLSCVYIFLFSGCLIVHHLDYSL